MIRYILDVPLKADKETTFLLYALGTHMAGWPRIESRQALDLSRRSAVPLIGFAVTTTGAWRPNQPPIDPIFYCFFDQLGDKDTGVRVTAPTLSTLMVNTER